VFLDKGDWPLGDLDYVLCERAKIVNNTKLLLRNLHGAVSRIRAPVLGARG
jgi:hypothetical protein